MLCSTCNKEIKEGTLICPHCRAMDAVNRQQLVTDKMQKKHRDVIISVFKSKHFLAYMLTLVFVAVAHLSVVFAEAKATVSLMLLTESVSVLGIIWLLIYIAFVFAPLRAMIASVRLYFNKDEHSFCSKMTGATSLARFWQKTFRIIRSLVSFVFSVLLIISILVLVAANQAKKQMDEIGSSLGEFGFGAGEAAISLFSGGLTAGAILLLVGIIVIGVLLIVLFSKCAGTYDKIDTYMKTLAETHASGGYFQFSIKVSAFRFYFLGVIFALLGGSTMVWGNSILEGMSAFGAFFVSNGVYLIMNGIFFKYADERVQASLLDYKSEKSKLDDLRKRSTAQQAEYLKQKKEEQEAQRKKELEQEKLRKELELQEKNSEMMQQMMKAFLAKESMAMAEAKNNAAKPSGTIAKDKWNGFTKK